MRCWYMRGWLCISVIAGVEVNDLYISLKEFVSVRISKEKRTLRKLIRTATESFICCISISSGSVLFVKKTHDHIISGTTRSPTSLPSSMDWRRRSCPTACPVGGVSLRHDMLLTRIPAAHH
jgi:hypothetical protein